MGPLGLPCHAFDLGVAAFVPPARWGVPSEVSGVMEKLFRHVRGLKQDHLVDPAPAPGEDELLPTRRGDISVCGYITRHLADAFIQSDLQ